MVNVDITSKDDKRKKTEWVNTINTGSQNTKVDSERGKRLRMMIKEHTAICDKLKNGFDKLKGGYKLKKPTDISTLPGFKYDIRIILEKIAECISILNNYKGELDTYYFSIYDNIEPLYNYWNLVSENNVLPNGNMLNSRPIIKPLEEFTLFETKELSLIL